MNADMPVVLLSSSQRTVLRSVLEKGLPIHPRPYAVLAEGLGCNEAQVLAQMQQWNNEGLFRRVGLVVRHRALGIAANLMLVLDVPDAHVDEAGRLLALEPAVTLCYRRRRALPSWRYNLFCMIHGREKDAVQRHAHELLQRHGMENVPMAMLFSEREFKQCGARYAPTPAEETP